jgi:uncharacterized protein (TIGR02145 family)/uncharacterized repeat protein (TIGR02543 family)
MAEYGVLRFFSSENIFRFFPNNIFKRSLYMRATVLKTASVAAFVFAASATAQDTTYAKVPFRVNVDAAITAVQGGNTVSKDVTGKTDGADTLKLPLEIKTASVQNTGRTQGRLNAPIITGSRGNITLRLPAQSYQNAEIALYSVNGKRILRGKAAASETISGISRKNVSAGVYLLSVKGLDGNAYTKRLTHSGGNMNINVAFGNENAPNDKPLAKQAAAGNWNITVSAVAAGYKDSTYTLNITVVLNPLQDIILTTTLPSGGNLVCADGEVWVYGETLNEYGGDAEVFLSNNEYWFISASADGTGFAKWKGTWSTSGNQLTLTGANGTRIDTDFSTYSVAGNKLTYTYPDGGTFTLTKVSGIVWDKTFNVNFNVNGAGGTVSPTSQRTDADRKLETLPTPTRSGYTFDSWYTLATGGTAVTTSTVFTEHKTIYARWTKGNNIDNYRVVQIGTQKWMAENLDNDVEGSVCYENSADSCAKYGRLYSWEAARTACPVGWHLPSDAEWTTLVNYAGGSSAAGTKLKSSQYWRIGMGGPAGVPAGTDDYGFSALPGGYGNSNGDFYGTSSMGNWWSATENNAITAVSRNMFSTTVNVNGEYKDKSSLFSVRCVQD